MAEDQNLEVTTPEGATTEAVEAPSWVPDKFKANPEKFGEAYVNLEREFHQTRQELKAQQETLEAYILEQQQAAVSRPAEQNNDALYAAYESDPVGTMAYLAQQAAQQAVEKIQPQLQQSQKPILQAQNDLLAYTVDQMVAQQIPDWADYKQKVGDYVSSRPYLLSEASMGSPQTAADALVHAYRAYRFEEVQNQGQAQAEALRTENERLKQQAQTLSGSPGRPAETDADKSYWDRVKNAPATSYVNFVEGR